MASLFGLRSESDQLRNLDFLRLLASVGIVYHHSHEFFYSPEVRSFMVERSEGLALFVDLFFAVSGFVMGFVYDGRVRNRREYGAFLWKRVARLYPLHLVVLALLVALWAMLLTRGASESAPSFTPDCLVAEALLLQAYYECGGSPFNGVTWSISVEMGMYVIFPLLTGLAMRSIVGLGLTCLIAVVAVVAMIPAGEHWAQAPWLLRGLAGFSFGFLLFKVRHKLPSIPMCALWVLALCAVALTTMLAGASQFLSMATLACLVTVAVVADRDGQVHPAVERLCPLGQLTYSIYIWHRLVILIFLNVVADKLFPGNAVVLWSMLVVTLVGIATLSYAGYFLIEVRARRALNALLPRSERRVSTTVAP